MKLIFVMVADFLPRAVSTFQAYETEVSALLSKHDGLDVVQRVLCLIDK